MANNKIIDLWQTAPNNGWAVDPVALGGYAKQIALGRNKDGRLECFYVGTNGNLYHNWQTAPNNGWAGEHSFAVNAQSIGDSAQQIAVGQNSDGRLEVFYVGSDNALCHNWQTAPSSTNWNGESKFANTSAYNIAVGQNLDGRLEVFWSGTDKAVYHDWQTTPNGAWYGATILVPVQYPDQYDIFPSLAVGRNLDGRLELFYAFVNQELYRISQTAPNGLWGEPKRFSGDSADQIAVGRNEDGRLEIFYSGLQQELYHNSQKAPNSDSWTGESRFAVNSAQQVAVGHNADGRIEIFYVGTNSNLYHNWQTIPNGNWAGETSFGQDCAQVTVISNADGRLEVMYVSQDPPPPPATGGNSPPPGTGGAPSAPNKWILAFDGPIYTPLFPYIDTEFKASVTIQNTGNVASPPLTIQFSIDDGPVATQAIAPVLSGYTTTITEDFGEGLDEGVHYLNWTLVETNQNINVNLAIFDNPPSD